MSACCMTTARAACCEVTVTFKGNVAYPHHGKTCAWPDVDNVAGHIVQAIANMYGEPIAAVW